jgi:hypothetical protein
MSLGEFLEKELKCNSDKLLTQEVSQSLSRCPHEKITFLSQIINLPLDIAVPEFLWENDRLMLIRLYILLRGELIVYKRILHGYY